MKGQIRVLLDCEHERWFTAGHLPNLNENIYCPACGDYQPAGPAGARQGESLIDGQWISTVTNGRYTGVCCDCGHTHNERNWNRLRTHMDGHHMREHVRSRFAPQFTTGPIPRRLPRDTPPPF